MTTATITREDEDIVFRTLDYASKHDISNKLTLIERIIGKLVGELGENARPGDIERSLLIRSAINGDPIEKEGGSIGVEDFRMALGGLSRATVNNYRKSGQVAAFRRGAYFQFPLFQIANGKILPGIDESLSVMAENGITDARTQCLRFLSPLTERNGNEARAIDLLRAGEIDRACDLIKASAEQ